MASPDANSWEPRIDAAASDLLARLDWARHATRDWQDAALTDALVERALDDALHALAQNGLWGEANQLPSRRFWDRAGPTLTCGTLQLHARTKPRGYAGDHELLARIARGTCCEDPLGRAFDRYFLQQAAPAAVRARIALAAAMLAEHRWRSANTAYCVTSVGSGPALDICRGLDLLPPALRHGMQVRLIDLDPDALDMAQRELSRSAGQQPPRIAVERVSARRENLFRLPGRPQAPAILGRPDLLICSGLFDYLADDVAAAMLACFWRNLAPGGRMLIGNFAPHNPTRAYMEWIGNWYLLYRTAEAMHALAAAAGLPPGCWQVTAERTGVDLFLVADRA